MATVTFVYTYDVDDETAAEMQRNYGNVYGHSALGAFVSSHRLPAIYAHDPHRIYFDYAGHSDNAPCRPASECDACSTRALVAAGLEAPHPDSAWLPGMLAAQRRELTRQERRAASRARAVPVSRSAQL